MAGRTPVSNSVREELLCTFLNKFRMRSGARQVRRGVHKTRCETGQVAGAVETCKGHAYPKLYRFKCFNAIIAAGKKIILAGQIQPGPLEVTALEIL